MRKMRRVFAQLIVIIFILSNVVLSNSLVFAAAGGNNNKKVAKDKVEVIVKYKDSSKSENVKTQVKNKLKLSKMTTTKKYKQQKTELIQIDEKDNINTVIQELKSNPNVEYAQPNYLLSISADSDFNKQWGLANTGQVINSLPGTAGVDINVQKAWSVTKGSSSVVVGVLDTGIDIYHNNLSSNIFNNKLEIAGNGIDDDGNGYIDDINGWDFANNDNSVYDSSESDKHGTHVSGIIASTAASSGVQGVAPQVKILPLKFVNGTTGYTSDAIEAIEYASKMGVKIINCSFGGSQNNIALKEAMANTDILFVTAAGNDGKDASISPTYPAGYGLNNIISVAAIDNQGKLASFSNYGATIDIAAPGVNILSTTPENTYEMMSGTSFAAPYVTGVAALIKSNLPDLTSAQMSQRLKTNAKTLTQLSGAVGTNGMVDAYQALGVIEGQAEGQPEGQEINAPAETIEDSLLSIQAVTVAPQLLEQIHFGESGVGPTTGNFSKTYIDMSMTAPGFTINISRTYNSKDDRTVSTLGRGWTFGFEGSLKDDPGNANIKIARLPDGSVQAFIKNSNGTYTANDSRSTLAKQSDNTHILTTKDQYTYKFSVNGYLVEMKDKNGNGVYIDVDSTNGQVKKITDQVGREFTVSYNGAGYITKITDPMSREINYKYDGANRLIKVIDAAKTESNYEYDSAGYLIKIKDHIHFVSDEIVYDHEAGANQHKVKTYKDKYGNTYSYVYDSTNRKTVITDSNSGDKQRVITKYYDTNLYITKSVDPERGTTMVEYYVDANGINVYGEEKIITDRNGNQTQYERDANGNITKTVNAAGSAREYTYDDKNNVILEKDELGNKNYYTYDTNKINLLKKAQPLNGTDEFNASSDLSKFAITEYQYYTDVEATALNYKAKSLLKKEINPEGGTVTYTYDEFGNTKTIQDADGNTTTMVYNKLGWLTKETSPSLYITQYTYDPAGRLVKKVSNGGETLRIVYDAMGRKIQEIKPNQYEFVKDKLNFTPIQYTYEDPNAGYRYKYYDNGSLKEMTDPEGNVTSYTYDLYGNVQTETKPNGATYIYQYDNINRNTKNSFRENQDGQEILLNEYKYEILPSKNTRKTFKQYINDSTAAVTTYTYDYADRLIEQINPDGTKRQNTYNGNGTLKTSKDENLATTYYRYDGLGRLIEVWSPIEMGKYSYKKTGYDKAGNIIREAVGKDKVDLFSIPAEDRLITQLYEYYKSGRLKVKSDSGNTKITYSYDPEGNLIKQNNYTSATEYNTVEYVYNYLGKVAQMKSYVASSDILSGGQGSGQTQTLVTTYQYDKNGNLTKQTNPAGTATTYKYDKLDRVVATSQNGTDENGMAAMITSATTYNWEGNPLTTKDANGNQTVYQYSERGFLEKIKKSTKNAQGVVADYITLYQYDRMGRKTKEVLPAHYDATKSIDQMNRNEYTYDSMGRITRTAYTGSITKYNAETASFGTANETIITNTYAYDSKGHVIREQNGEAYKLGYNKEYFYDLAGNILMIMDPVSKENGLSYMLKYDYDGAGRKISETNANGVIKLFYYDDSNRIISTAVKKSAEDPEQILQANVYDYAGNLLAATDANGNTIRYEYNAFNKVRRAIYPADENVPDNVVTYWYDAVGNMVKQQDTMGTTDLFTYDRQGRQLSHTQQDKDGKETITTYSWYDKNGNVRYNKDGNGNKKEFVYDQLNNLISTKAKVSGINGQEITKIEKYEYDKNGNQTKYTDWLGNVTLSVYDQLDRLIEKKDANGDSMLRAVYNNNSMQTLSIDAKDNVTKFSYDANDRLIATTDPKGDTVKQTYDKLGNLASSIDGMNNSTKYKYDYLNRLIEVTNALGEKTKYTYDLNGNRLTQTDGNGNTVTTEYNVQNKPVRRIDHGGMSIKDGVTTYTAAKVESYIYNPNGTLKEKTDRNGVKTEYIYDSHGRLLTQKAGAEQIQYTYDNNNNTLTVQNSSGTITRTYDEENRVLAKIISGTGATTFQYDITSGLESGKSAETSTDPKGNKVTKVYDKVGRLSEVRDYGKGSTPEVTAYQYEPNGNTKSVEYKVSGTKSVYTYFANNLLESLTNYRIDGSTGLLVTMDIYKYTYDAAHNQLTKTERIDGNDKGITTYKYDPLNRLEKVLEPNAGNTKVTEYIYDKAGNRIGETTTVGAETTYVGYKYNEQNRLISQEETKTNGERTTTKFNYDNNGNLILRTAEIVKPADENLKPSFGMIIIGQTAPTTLDPTLNKIIKSTVVYGYNPFNQMSQTKSADQTINYKYNGEGYRIEKKTNDSLTRYVYEYDKVILELNDKNQQTARNTYGTNLISRTADGEQLYYFYNGHADVTALLDKAGQLQGSYYYDAFGNILESSGDVNNPIRYAGYQYDDETGYYYLNARYYDPKIARFLTEDTYGGEANDPLSLNKYTYCQNNPIMYWDPTGHKAETEGSKSKNDNAVFAAKEQVKATVVKVTTAVKTTVTTAVQTAVATAKTVATVAVAAAKVVVPAVISKITEPIKSIVETTKAVAPIATPIVKALAPAVVANVAAKSTEKVVPNNTLGINNDVYDFTKGVISGIDDNVTFGLGQKVKGELEGESKAYQLGKVTTDAVSTVVGVALMVAGGGAEVVGVGLDATIVGAPAGVAINTAGVALIGTGAVISGNSVTNLVKDTKAMFADAAEGSGGSSTNWKSVKEYGHTFNTHGSGAKNTKSLTDRARSTGNNQGQWLDNQKAAEYLKSLGEINEPTTIPIPEGIGQVITPTGEIVPATKAIVVPSTTGIKTAYPIP